MEILLQWSEPENKDGGEDKNYKESCFYYWSGAFFISIHATLVALKRAPTVYWEVRNPVFPGDPTFEKPTCSIRLI
jgi:hypothetical protein